MIRSKLAVSAVAAATVLASMAACSTSSDDAAPSTTTSATTASTSTTTEPTVEVTAWATGFCNAFSTWLDAIGQASQRSDEGAVPGDRRRAQAIVIELFDAAAAVTEELIDDIGSNGVPNLDGGDQLVADLTAKFRAFASAASDVSRQVAALDVSSSTFAADLTELIGEYQHEADEVGDSFTRLGEEHPSPELESAITEACDL